jgi:threonine dehydratase
MTGNTILKIPDFADVEAAARRLEGLILDTPVIRVPELDAGLGCLAFLKCENLQETGSFKLRGASNAVAMLREAGDVRAVATHSSGNHGAALALAASRDGRSAHVVMPRNSVPAKLAAVRRYGGEVILCEPTQAAREEGLARLVARGMASIPPYEHPDVIAGQGTVAMELIDFMKDTDILIMPVGGGGLLAGCAIAARTMRTHITLYGAEPAGAADAWQSLRTGERVTSLRPDTIADGLRAVIGGLNFDIIKERVDDILLVEEADIVDAMRWVWKHAAMPVEPSSAVAIAAMRRHRDRFRDARVGVVITGGNVDYAAFPWLRESPGD